MIYQVSFTCDVTGEINGSQLIQVRFKLATNIFHMIGNQKCHTYR